ERDRGEGASPRKRNETIRRPVAVPGGLAVEELPVAVAEGGLAEDGQQALVKLHQLVIDWLLGAADEMRRNPHLLPLELALVEKAKSRRKKRQHRGGLVLAGRERGGGPRLVVILQKPR